MNLEPDCKDFAESVWFATVLPLHEVTDIRYPCEARLSALQMGNKDVQPDANENETSNDFAISAPLLTYLPAE